MSAERQQRYRDRLRAEGQPVEARDKARERKAAWRAARREQLGLPEPSPRRRMPQGRRRSAKRRCDLPFMGIDGEGCGVDAIGRQNYMLMCAANADDEFECYTGQPLTLGDCLEFILSLPLNVQLVAFSFGYDITMMACRDLSAERRRKLLAHPDDLLPSDSPNADRYEQQRVRRSAYTYWRDYGLEYMPNRYFRVCRIGNVLRDPKRPELGTKKGVIEGTTRTIYDAHGFFQRSFARALADHDIGSKSERRMIARNKAARDSFVSMTREVRDYCMLECELLAQAMDKLRDVWERYDMTPRQPTGAGQLAQALLQKWGVITNKELAALPKMSGVLMHADAAYYGGRFELQWHGKLPPLHEYDLRSAYPAAMVKACPCLAHGTWRYVKEAALRKAFNDPDALFVCSVRYRHNGTSSMYGLPHRQSGREDPYRTAAKGAIAWVRQGQGTYWSVELRSAAKLGCTFGFGEGWLYEKRCDCVMFDKVAELFALRLTLGDSTAGHFLKLAINSLYGKLAQQVGNPTFSNLIWAGIVTATTRAWLNEAIAQAPDKIVMIATDGIYSLAPLDLPEGNQLGQWKHTVLAGGMFVVQPGIYWSADKAAFKTRGLSPRFFGVATRARFHRTWQRWLDGRWERLRPDLAPEVPVGLTMFCGLRAAQAQGKPERAGMWLSSRHPKSHPNYLEPRLLSFGWLNKRSGMRRGEGPCCDAVRSFPLAGGPAWISTTYAADPSLEADYEEWLYDTEEQPDHVKRNMQDD